MWKECAAGSLNWRIFSTNTVSICLLSETILNSNQAFRLAKYVCHRTDRPTAGAAQPSYSAGGIVYYTVPVPGRSHFEATAFQVTFAGKPAVILAAYLSPSRLLIGANLTACFGWGLPVLTAGDLSAKYVNWNSQLSTRRGKLLHDYADENSSLIFGPDSPTTTPYNPSVIPDLLEIVITKNLSFPANLTSCSALSSENLPVLIDTACRSSFHRPPERHDFRHTDWANFQSHLEDLIPFDPELHNEMAI